MSKPVIQSKIVSLQAERSDRTQVTADRIVEELAAIGLSDITDVVSFGREGVRVRESGAIPKHITSAIQSIRIESGQYGPRITVKIHSKDAALARLVQLLGFDREAAIRTVLTMGYQVVDLTDGRQFSLPSS